VAETKAEEVLILRGTLKADGDRPSCEIAARVNVSPDARDKQELVDMSFASSPSDASCSLGVPLLTILTKGSLNNKGNVAITAVPSIEDVPDGEATLSEVRFPAGPVNQVTGLLQLAKERKGFSNKAEVGKTPDAEEQAEATSISSLPSGGVLQSLMNVKSDSMVRDDGTNRALQQEERCKQDLRFSQSFPSILQIREARESNVETTPLDDHGSTFVLSGFSLDEETFSSPLFKFEAAPINCVADPLLVASPAAGPATSGVAVVSLSHALVEVTWQWFDFFRESSAVGVVGPRPTGIAAIREETAMTGAHPTTRPFLLAASALVTQNGDPFLVAVTGSPAGPLASSGTAKQEGDFKPPFSPALVAAHVSAKSATAGYSKAVTKHFQLHVHQHLLCQEAKPVSLAGSLPFAVGDTITPPSGLVLAKPSLLRAQALAAAASAQSTASLALAELALVPAGSGDDELACQTLMGSILCALKRAEEAVERLRK
jgi:hypothetical protein